MAVIGISMSSLILGNYLAQHSEEARQILTVALIISVPWSKSFKQHFEFDDNDQQYYSEAVFLNKLHSISVPLLCFNAADDPIPLIKGLLELIFVILFYVYLIFY